MTFEAFDVEASPSGCGYDYVVVSYVSFRQRFCGTSIPGPFTSTGSITVTFHTDNNKRKTGFIALWTPFGRFHTINFTYILLYYNIQKEEERRDRFHTLKIFQEEKN